MQRNSLMAYVSFCKRLLKISSFNLHSSSIKLKLCHLREKLCFDQLMLVSYKMTPLLENYMYYGIFKGEARCKPGLT